ncbi:large ribosomal subunit protein mL66-like [Ornithodoros turicata]|uniref:Putative 28s ribosomal protein s18a n=1 Tax=Ornithodoros turicata TaxID=34597 RepID=A0A2R5L4G9_9ACAR
MALSRITARILARNALKSLEIRTFQTSSSQLAKKIQEREENGTTIIEAIYVDSPRKGRVVKTQHSNPGCPLCRLGITNLKYTDVLITSQFMDSKGKLLPQHVTGLCNKQHKQMGLLLYQAQRSGLLHNEERLPRERWQELNNYFGKTKLKIDFGKPLLDINEYLKKPNIQDGPLAVLNRKEPK